MNNSKSFENSQNPHYSDRNLNILNSFKNDNTDEISSIKTTNMVDTNPFFINEVVSEYFSEELGTWITLTKKDEERSEAVLKYIVRISLQISFLIIANTPVFGRSKINEYKKDSGSQIVFENSLAENQPSSFTGIYKQDFRRSKSSLKTNNSDLNQKIMQQAFLKFGLALQMREYRMNAEIFNKLLISNLNSNSLLNNNLTTIYKQKNLLNIKNLTHSINCEKIRKPITIFGGENLTIKNTKEAILWIIFFTLEKVLEFSKNQAKKSRLTLAKDVAKTILLLFGVYISYKLIYTIIKMIISKTYRNQIIKIYIDDNFDIIENNFEKLITYFYPQYNSEKQKDILFLKLFRGRLKKIITELHRIKKLSPKDSSPIDSFEKSKKMQKHFEDMNNEIKFLNVIQAEMDKIEKSKGKTFIEEILKNTEI